MSVAVEYSAADLLAVPDASKITASIESRADLTDFRVALFGTGSLGFVVLHFESLSFTAKTGQDPAVKPNLKEVEFLGAMQYIAELARYLLPESGLFNPPGGGGASPVPATSSAITPYTDSGGGLEFTPIFNLTSDSVAVGFTLGIPTIAVGVFSLSNLEVGMLVTLPFNDDPLTARFNVCRADRPFQLTVGIFGGGGYFELEIGLNGVRSLVISLEFGAAASLDVGVASGSVSVVAGITFSVVDDGSGSVVTLQGFVRLNGRLEILGIITISVEFLLSLTYVSPPGVAKGRAKVTVTVEVAFFSKDVSMEVEKTFGGGETGMRPVHRGPTPSLAPPPPSGGPVRYVDLMTSDNYLDYVAAFA